jgi:membrane peptidoglycan carboxypeptidase
VLAAENRTFFTDSGVSAKGIARAVVTKATGGETQGGSTITQQLVKNVYLTQDKTVDRKFREFFISLKLDKERQKNQILEDYLNTIYFGRGAYGVEAAAQAYFNGKSAQNVGIGEAAVLAALIRNANLYDPWKQNGEPRPQARARLEARFTYVINGMVEMGAITPEQAAQVRMPRVEPWPRTNRHGLQRGYIKTEVEKELAAIDPERFSPEALMTGGFKIKTTLDAGAMNAATKAVDGVITENKIPPYVRIGLAAVNPKDGRIIAMYGGRDAVKFPGSNATHFDTQPGSTFKAFTLAAALSKDEPVLLESRFAGNSPFKIPNTGPDEPVVANEDDEDFGETVDLVQATRKSVNTAFVDLAMEVGPKRVMDAAVAAGIPKESKDLLPNARVTLGIAKTRVIDLAHAYATFAANGVENKPFLVDEVRDANGELIYKAKPKGKKVFDEAVVSNVTWALEQVVSPDGTGRFAAENLGRPAAGKTGTAEVSVLRPEDKKKFKGTNTSAWFVGYTPQVSAAVAIYRERLTDSLKGVGGQKRINGGSFPTQIWTAFMKAVHEGKEIEEFPERERIEDGKVINPEPERQEPDRPRDENNNGDENGRDNPSDPQDQLPKLPDPTISVPPLPPPGDQNPDPKPTDPPRGPRCPPFCIPGDPDPNPEDPPPPGGGIDFRNPGSPGG